MHALRTPAVPREWLRFGLVVSVVYGVWAALIRAGAFNARVGLLTAGAAADLFGTVGIAYWLLIVRRGRGRPRSILAVLALSFLGARLLLPPAAFAPLASARVLLSVVELAVLLTVLVQFRRARALAPADGDLGDRITAACAAIVANTVAARFVAAELATLAYAASPAPARGESPQEFAVEPPFARALLTALIGVLAVETVPAHLLVAHWSIRAAWALTVASIYSVLWLIGQQRAARARRCAFEGDTLALRIGLRCTARIRVSDLAGVRRLAWRDADRLPPGTLNTARPGTPNVLLEFATPTRVVGPMGIERTISHVALGLADPSRFVAAVAAQLPQGQR